MSPTMKQSRRDTEQLIWESIIWTPRLYGESERRAGLALADGWREYPYFLTCDSHTCLSNTANPGATWFNKCTNTVNSHDCGGAGVSFCQICCNESDAVGSGCSICADYKSPHCSCGLYCFTEKLPMVHPVRWEYFLVQKIF